MIKRLGSSPLPRSGLLAGKVGGLLVVEVLQVVVVSVVGLLLGWHPADGVARSALLAVVLGTFAFAALGLLLAGVLRAEATLAAANLVYLLLLAAGAVVLPTSSYGAFGHVAAVLPSGALGDAMRHAFLSTAASRWAPPRRPRSPGALVGTALTARTFRWE